MSDIEDYSILSDNDDDNDSQVSFNPNKNIKKNIHVKPTIRDYDDDDDDGDNIDIDENEENDENEILKENDNANEDDYVDNDIDDNEDDIEDNDEDGDEDDDEDGDDDDEDNSDIEYDNDELEQHKQSGGKPKEKKQSNIALDSQNDYDDFDDDEEQNENYLQKFDKELTKNYIMDFHPECLNHNYDEIKSLSVVTRDEHNIIIDPLHKTLPFLTKYEQARVLGQRAKQIECGAKPLVKVPENIIDGYIIAKLELEQKNIPFIIRRPIPNGGSEYWNIKDLEMIAF